MENTNQKSVIGVVLNDFATPVIDVLTLVGFFYLVPFLVTRFSTRSIWNLGIIAGMYIIMCFGIYICKKLERNPGEENLPKSAPAFVLWLSWPFAAFVIAMVIEVCGVFVSGSTIGASLDQMMHESMLGHIIFVVAFLIILLLFPLFLLIPFRSKVKYGTPTHWLLRVFGVAAVDAMMLVTSAFWEWEMLDAEPMEVGLGGKIFIFIVSYPVFLMFYAPPRLALLSLERTRWSFTGYAILLGYIVWKLMK